MSTPIATKKFTNNKLQLDQQIVVWQLTIDAKSEIIVIVYQIETLSPTGIIVATSDNQTYTRYNKQPLLDADGITIITQGNMKFDALRSSALGQGIAGLIGSDLNLIKSLDTLITDLAQN